MTGYITGSKGMLVINHMLGIFVVTILVIGHRLLLLLVMVLKCSLRIWFRWWWCLIRRITLGYISMMVLHDMAIRHVAIIMGHWIRYVTASKSHRFIESDETFLVPTIWWRRKTSAQGYCSSTGKARMTKTADGPTAIGIIQASLRRKWDGTKLWQGWHRGQCCLLGNWGMGWARVGAPCHAAVDVEDFLVSLLILGSSAGFGAF
jgi:hypothetical protein